METKELGRIICHLILVVLLAQVTVSRAVPETNDVRQSFEVTREDLERTIETYRSQLITHTQFTSYNPFGSNPDCDSRTDDYRIQGGRDVIPNQMPWAAIIAWATHGFASHGICSGVLISYDWVLTAAHCVDEPNLFALIIKAGVYSRDEFHHSPTSINFANSSTIHICPDFLISRFYCDLALIKVEFRNNNVYPMKPACLPPSNVQLMPFHPCFVAGWGWTHPNQTGETQKLQTMRLFYLNRVQEIIYTKIQSYYSNPRGVCDGDSGGPLMCSVNGRKTLIGTLSAGYESCDNRILEAEFTSVAYHLRWIRQVIANNQG